MALTSFLVMAICAMFAACAWATPPVTPATQPSGADLAARAEARRSNPNRPTRWWTEISTKPDSWYRSDEGLRIAENILSWQDNGTGWPLMNTTREPFTGDVSRAGPWGMRGALIKATVNEIRFLARAHRATQDPRYLQSMLGGIGFVLAAQYPSGGWPHSFPVRREDYSRHATFNDDLMPDLMMLLSEIGRGRDFESVPPDIRERARAAFDKGVEFVLKAQIRVDGTLTAWCQQHDEVTYAPRPARAFEPVAISSSESASVLFMLMSIDKPSPEVAAAIEAAVEWFRDAQINGIGVAAVDGDRIVRPNENAPPLWARFYEIGTNRPIFAGRDGVVRYSLAEIERERRTGYAWYNRAGTEVFARYDKWKYAQRWRDRPKTNTDEALVGPYTLPDPLKLSDGTVVASADVWEQQRRPELMRLFEQHQFGVTPSTTIRPRVEFIERGGSGLGGTARRTQVRIRFSDDPAAPMIRVLRYVPTAAEGPVPTLLHLGFSPAVQVVDEPGIDEAMAWSGALKARVPDRDARAIVGFDPRSIISRGYGVALVYYGDISPDFEDGGKHGVRTLFGSPPAARAPDEWGSIGAWSWGLSRVLDYLRTDPAVDAERVALSGVSRLGKTVLWAGAQDQRFAMVIPLLSGEGGAAISRRNFGETIADLTKPSRYPYWYAPRYAEYAFNVDRLPVDGHLLVSLIAPRPVLLIVGSEDAWSDPRGEFVAANAAAPVYALYGKRGLQTTDYPAPGTAILHDIGFFMHDGGHKTLPIDFTIIADFMDRHFRR